MGMAGAAGRTPRNNPLGGSRGFCRAVSEDVDVQPDRFVVDEPVFTTGGATPALDCLLSLIRARNGYSAALDVASLYIYEEVRTGSDAQPIVSLGRIRQHEPPASPKAIRIMEAHIDRPLTIAAIARRVGESRRERWRRCF